MVRAPRRLESTLQHLQRRGRLDTTYLSGPVAEGGHLEVLQWLRANGCPRSVNALFWCGVARASRGAAVAACERLPLGRGNVLECGVARTPRYSAVGAR